MISHARTVAIISMIIAATVTNEAGATGASSWYANAAHRTAFDCVVVKGNLANATSTATPLDRIVTASGDNVTVGEALDMIAKAARVRLSFSPDLLPSKQICFRFERAPVGAILEALIAGAPLRVIVAGVSQIVLTPARRSVAETTTFARSSQMLEQVVVTGAPDGALLRGSAIGVDVIDRAMMVQHGVSTVAQALELASPGVWMWPASSGVMTANYGSIRGASSFGTNAPKVYIDGVEVANALLVTQLDASRLERIEVIKGPQGAALYGADAISGVVNIVTRLDGTPSGAAEFRVASNAGVSESEFVRSSAIAQQHSFSVRGGGNSKTGGAGILLSSTGEYLPGASELRLLADASSRSSIGNGILTTVGRYSMQRANAVVAPVVPLLGDSLGSQSIHQFTAGATATIAADNNWTFAATAGVDGFRVKGLSEATLPVSVSARTGIDNGGAERYSLRLRSNASAALTTRVVASLTMAAEYAMLRDHTSGDGSGSTSSSILSGRILRSSWSTNNGVMAQGDISIGDRVYVTAGSRLEQTVGAAQIVQNEVIPVIGAAFVHEMDGMSLKVRAGYGKGIRPAQTMLRGASWMARTETRSEALLFPESQSGTEVGIDAAFGGVASLQVTRFDQRAAGLIQPVIVEQLQIARPGQPVTTSVLPLQYVLQNIGVIENVGWEVKSSAKFKRLALNAWYSNVNSRVVRVSDGYTGDMREGDTPMYVPKHTVGISAFFTHGRMRIGASAAHASDWVSYDRVRLASYLAQQQFVDASSITGAKLRNFWTSYDGVTRMRGNISWNLSGNTQLHLGGDNLLNVQKGAPDNAAFTVGRTVTLGISAFF